MISNRPGQKTFLNPSGWIDLDYLIDQNKLIFGILKALFRKPQPAQAETFEAAMTRLELSEADVSQRASSYRKIAWFFAFFTFISFTYAFFLLFRYKTILGFLLASAMTALFAVQGYKYDFWSYQLRQRRLGATFAEWKRDTLGL